MSRGILPKDPKRADHRMMVYILDNFLGGKIQSDPKVFDLIGKVYMKAGGSWQRLFQGSPQDFELLRKCMKAAIKRKLLKKKPSL